tara:strand:- start:7333 stop:7899 length:567 start_codon:yes stop_codon:yes gene_type:complete
MKIIIKAVKERQDCIDYLKESLPEAIFCMDEKKCAFDTFLRSLEMAEDDPCIHMEEDIFLTKNFLKKAMVAIRSKPMSLIQFFSMRKKDLTEGSRWDRNFLMNQCFYAPPVYSRLLLKYFAYWEPKNIKEHPNGTDAMVRDFLKDRKEKYWIHCPSLVDHRQGKSVIDPRRSSKRQSFTFVERVEQSG